MSHLAGGIDVDAVGFRHHSPEESNIDGVIDIGQVLGFEFLECLLRIVGVGNGDDGIRHVIDLFDGKKHQGFRLLGLFTRVLTTRFLQFESHLSECHLRQAGGGLVQCRITLDDNVPQHLDDPLGADSPVSVRKGINEVLAGSPLHGLGGDPHAANTTEGGRLRGSCVIPVWVGRGKGLQDVNVDETCHGSGSFQFSWIQG